MSIPFSQSISLPTSNVKLLFGDEDSYIFESADDVIEVWIGGSAHSKFNATGLRLAWNSNYSELTNNSLTLAPDDSPRTVLNPGVVDGSSAVAYILDTVLSVTGAKIMSVRNQGNEQFYVDKDGNVNIPTGSNYMINGVPIGGSTSYWSKSGTDLSPITAGDDILLPNNDAIGWGSTAQTYIRGAYDTLSYIYFYVENVHAASIGTNYMMLKEQLRILSASGIAGFYISNNSGAIQGTSAANTSGSGYTLTWKGGESQSTNSAHTGGHVYIEGGIQAGTGGGNGGSIYIYGGLSVSANRGSIYLGDGSTFCTLAIDETETYLVAIDPTTGLLSRRSATSLGGGDMVYPGVGIAVSTGSAWATSITPSTGYLYYTGSAYSWKNETYSLSSHNHTGVYATTIHNLIDTTNHPVSGLTTGHFLKATGATTYAFAAHGLTYTDVGAAANSHAHGDITSAGAITSAAVTPGSSDYIVITDSSASNVLKRGVLIGTGTTTYLRNDGTWGTPAGNYTLPLAADGTRGGIQIGYSAYNQYLAVQLSSEKAYIALTSTAIETVLTGTITSHNHTGIYQPLATNLTSLAALSYVSASFVKMTATGTFSLDTNTYSLSSHNHSGVYEPALDNPSTDGYVLSSTTAGVRSWIAPASIPATVVKTDQVNTYDDFAQSFKDDIIRIYNPADTFYYTINASAITANRILNLPLIDGTDTITVNGLASTFTAAKTFYSSMLLLRNPANTYSYTFVGAAIIAARSITLPLLTGNDTMVTAAFTQTLTNKTINATNNTISDTSQALGDLLKNSGTKFVRFAKGTALQVLRVNSGGTDLEWATLSSGGVTLSGSTNDTICTVTGADAIQGEANLTFSSTNVLTINSTSLATIKALDKTSATGINLVIEGSTANTTGYTGGHVYIRGGAAQSGNACGSVYIYSNTIGTEGHILLGYNGASTLGYVGVRGAADTAYAMKITGKLNITEGMWVIEAPGTDHTAEGIKVSMTAGESLVMGNPVYFKSDGKVWRADANAATMYPVMGLAMTTASANGAVEVLLYGIVRDDTWAWTVGGVIYLSANIGEMTQSAPTGSGTRVQVCGVATHADRMFFNPSLDLITLSA